MQRCEAFFWGYFLQPLTIDFLKLSKILNPRDFCPKVLIQCGETTHERGDDSWIACGRFYIQALIIQTFEKKTPWNFTNSSRRARKMPISSTKNSMGHSFQNFPWRSLECLEYPANSPIAISLGSYMDKAAGRRACTSKNFTQDVSVLSRCCFGVVSVLSRWCLGVVLVMSRSCLGRVSVLSLSFLGDVSAFFWRCFCDVSVGRISVLSLSFFGDVSVLFWCCFVGFLVVFWGSFSDVLVVGDVSGMFRWSLRDVWWWCCDVYDDEWVMAWCCVVDVAVPFFCFGGGVLIFWWWTLMSILIGFLSKISNSNSKLYIVHLWANQCSCGPYVDGWCFKIEKFMLSVMSRSCLRDVSVLVLCCLGDVSGCHSDVSVLFS